MKEAYRHTKIIATLGPATESKPMLAELIKGGVDVIRLNMAHATHQWVADALWFIREVSPEVGRHVAVMMDVKGPEIRTGTLPEPLELRTGDLLEFVVEDGKPTGDAAWVPVNYAGLPDDVKEGGTILVDSGLLRMKVMARGRGRVRCEVLTPGRLGSKRHLNLPGVHVRLPALTAKDEDDLRAGIAAGIDFVALSFVRQADDIRVLRQFLDSHGSSARIIAKIEDQSGLRNSAGIIAAADAVMVARGDLGIEIDYDRLPIVQMDLVRACQAAGKPVIIATHLLESMIVSPMPTRAEVSDVSHAVREMADAVMLSGETTTGAYPLEALQVLRKIIGSTEPVLSRGVNDTIRLGGPKERLLRAAALLAQDLENSGIVVFTKTGSLPWTLAGLRARGVPIYGFTDVPTVFRQMLLPWGVEPFLIELSGNPEETIARALLRLRERGWCVPGQWLVVITNVLASGSVIDTIQLRQVP